MATGIHDKALSKVIRRTFGAHTPIPALSDSYLLSMTR